MNQDRIRKAVSTDVETIARFNISLCRETEGRELDPVTVTNGARRFMPRILNLYPVAAIDEYRIKWNLKIFFAVEFLT